MRGYSYDSEPEEKTKKRPDTYLWPANIPKANPGFPRKRPATVEHQRYRREIGLQVRTVLDKSILPLFKARSENFPDQYFQEWIPIFIERFNQRIDCDLLFLLRLEENPVDASIRAMKTLRESKPEKSEFLEFKKTVSHRNEMGRWISRDKKELRLDDVDFAVCRCIAYREAQLVRHSWYRLFDEFRELFRKATLFDDVNPRHEWEDAVLMFERRSLRGSLQFRRSIFPALIVPQAIARQSLFIDLNEAESHTREGSLINSCKQCGKPYVALDRRLGAETCDDGCRADFHNARRDKVKWAAAMREYRNRP